MPPNPLDPSAVLETLPTLLPRDSASSPATLRTPQDGLAALFHTALARLDFRLIGLTEDDRLSDYAQPSQPSASASGSAEASASTSTDSAPPVPASQANILPPAWNRNGPESYTLRYRHDQSSLTFLIKLLRMSTRVLVHASAVEDNKTATWELPLSDYTSASFFPFPREASASSSTAPEPLVHGFISSSRLNDLLLAFKGKIIQKLIPGLRKEGYEESPAEAEQEGADARRAAQPQPPRRPLQGEPDDPTWPSTVPSPFAGGRNPLAIGDRDLDPLGGARPPGAGFGPPPLFGPAGGGGGGMYVGPDDPIFRDRFNRPGAGGVPAGGGQGQTGPWGGDGFLPPGAVPPGARFDPVGPWGAGPRLPRGGGQGGPGAPGGGSGDPDWDDVRPPGGNSEYDNMFM